jgi:DNA-directed RNA polymerase subunit M/transcription elongation factor TFIIS
MEEKITFQEDYRRKIREYLNTKTNGRFTPKQIVFMEISIFNGTLKIAQKHNVLKIWENPEFVFLYTNHLRSVIVNLTEENMRRLETKELDFKLVGDYTHMQWNPSKWEEIIIAKEKMDNYKEVYATTTTFTCGKCKGNECIFRELQTRSADEGSTLFVTCCNTRCNHKFVIHN